MPRIVFTAGTRTVREIEVKEGTTPQEIVVAAHPETKNFSSPTICIYEGKPLLRKFWEDVKLRANDVLIFSELAMGGGGGGSNPLVLILGIVVMALAVWAGPIIAGALGFAETGFAAALITGTLGTIGMLGVNALAGALAPPPSVPSSQGLTSKNEAISPTYSIQDRTNKARIYQPEPEGFGKMLIVPDVVAQPWSQYIGNEHYFYAVYGCGRGEYEVNELRFGETTFWRNGSITDSAYSNVSLEFVPEGRSVTLFPDNVETSVEVNGQELRAADDGGTNLGPYVVNPPGSVVTKIMISISLPRGLFWMHPYYQEVESDVKFNLHYRAIDDFGNATSSWAVLMSQEIRENTKRPLRYTFEASVPSGRYEVYMQPTWELGGRWGTVIHEVRWESLVAVLPGSLQYGQSCIAVRIKADNTLTSQAANQFKVLQTRKLPLWRNGSWTSPQPTQSFAAAISWVCKNRLGGDLTDRQIDLEALWGMEPTLNQRGWTFNYWLDGGTLMWPMIIEWCSCAMIIPRLVGTMLSFVMEGPNRPVRCDITPYHIVRGTFSPSWSTHTDETPDDVIIEYLDPDAGYAQRDVRAKLPDSESSQPSRRRIPYVGSRKQAHDIGVYVAASNRWRRIKCTFEVEGMGRNLYVGDVITVKHPRLRNANCSAVYDYDAGQMRIDAEGDIRRPEPENGSQALYLGFSMPNGRPWGPCKVARIEGSSIWLDPSDYATILSQGQPAPFNRLRTVSDGGVPTVWTLYTSRAYSRRMLVQSVKPTSLYRFTVTCVNDDDRVYGYNIPVPPWDHRGQLPEQPTVTAPQSLRVTVGGTPQAPILTASWLPVPGAQSYSVEYSFNGTGWTNAGRPQVNVAEISAIPGSAYVRVAAVGSGQQSPWATWSGNTTMSRPAAPAARLAKPYSGGRLEIAWDDVPNSISYTVRVYDSALKIITADSITGTSWVYTSAEQFLDDGPRRMLRARVFAVNYSGESDYSEVSVNDVVPTYPQNAAVTVDPDAKTATITADTPIGTDVTGWVALRLRVPKVTSMADVLESRVVNTLPVVFSDIDTSVETYYSLAAKDAFFDVSGEALELNYINFTVKPV